MVYPYFFGTPNCSNWGEEPRLGSIEEKRMTAPVPFKVLPMPETVWVDRFAIEIGRLGAVGSPEQFVALAHRLWETMGRLQPQQAARTQFDFWEHRF